MIVFTILAIMIKFNKTPRQIKIQENTNNYRWNWEIKKKNLDKKYLAVEILYIQLNKYQSNKLIKIY